MPRQAVNRERAAKRPRAERRALASKVGVQSEPVKKDGVSLRPAVRFMRRTLQDNVYDYIREALMAGQFAPGQRLTVRGVAAMIGTSVMPVREAFRRLTSEGALEPLSTGATRVPVFDLPKLQDLHEIRLVVEGLATRRAAHRITDEELRLLEQCNSEIQSACVAEDWAAEANVNERFHFMIYRAAHSPELLRIIEHLWLKIGPYLAWLLKNQDRWPVRVRGSKSFRHHKEILLALRRHDAEQAELAIRADLMTSADALIIDPERTSRSLTSV